MPDSKSRTLATTSIGRQLDVAFDKQALLDVLSDLKRPGGNQEWCIACGAGKGIEALDRLDWVQNTSQQVFQGKTLPEFVESLKDLGKQAWCIACGAGKDASPLDQLANPADLADDVIDGLARRLITAVRIG